jgi:hypothetical protein
MKRAGSGGCSRDAPEHRGPYVGQQECGYRVGIVSPRSRLQVCLPCSSRRLRRTRRQPYFLRGGRLTQTHALLAEQFLANISRDRYVVTSTSARELGLHDGFCRELVDPAHVKTKPRTRSNAWQEPIDRRSSVQRSRHFQRERDRVRAFTLIGVIVNHPSVLVPHLRYRSCRCDVNDWSAAESHSTYVLQVRR